RVRKPSAPTPASAPAFSFGPLTMTIETSSIARARKAFTDSRMRYSPIAVPPTVTRIVFFRKNKSSRSCSRDALNGRTIGLIRRTFGHDVVSSRARIRSTFRASRENQKFPYPSNRREAGSLANSWRNPLRMIAVGIRWRTASRTEVTAAQPGGVGGVQRPGSRARGPGSEPRSILEAHPFGREHGPVPERPSADARSVRDVVRRLHVHGPPPRPFKLHERSFDRGTCGPREVPVPPGGVRLHSSGACDSRGIAVRAGVCPRAGDRAGPSGW